MKMETKFNFGDMVFVLAANKVHNVKIIGVNVLYSDTIERIDGHGTIRSSTPKQYVTYRVIYASGGETKFEETEVFATKEDLLKSL